MGVVRDLESMRKARGWRQAELAQRAGLARGTISQIESGAVDPQLSTVVEYCRAVGVELMIVPTELLAEVKAFVASGGKCLAQPPGIGAPLSIVDLIARGELRR